MQILHLLIDDDFIEDFVKSLPRDKVLIVEKEFKENKILLQKELESYQQNQNEPVSYQQSKKDLDEWLKQKA